MTFEVICTAVLTPGVTTQRVDRVIRPRKEARELIGRASRIFHRAQRIEDRRRRGAERQRRIAERRLAADLRRSARAERPDPVAHERSNPARPFRIISISTYTDTLVEIDAAVSRLRAAGHTKMSRSELLRIAFGRLDLDSLVASRG